MLDLDFLDDDQRDAVTARDGVVRIMAGAGTGKTTTLKSRIAYIIDQGLAQSSEIMAVTFTNKAAREIRERVEQTVGEDAAGVRMGTFHALSLRILRRYAEMTGLESARFTIVDDDEIKQIMDEALTNAGVYPEFEEPPKLEGMTDKVHSDLKKKEKRAYDKDRKAFLKEATQKIQRWKECGLHIEQATAAESLANQERQFVALYEEYQSLLDMKNMCDFSDLLLRVVHLFDRKPDIAARESRRIKYLLVDEFQDTNMLQFRWLQHLYRHSGNLFVVGDVDQSLYSFRGSAPQIMERLSDSAPYDVVLKSNRRCTQEILAPANRLVDCNSRPSPKQLDAGKRGDPVKYVEAANDFSEVKVVVKRIKELIAAGEDPDEMAIIARAAFVLKPYEKELITAGIPYYLMGGNTLLEKEEVKDMLAFVKLAVDPYNEIAFSRVANKPSRGLGPTTLKAITDVAAARRVPMHEACFLITTDAVETSVGKSKIEAVAALGAALAELSSAVEMDVQPALVMDMAYEDTGYCDYIKDRNEEDDAKQARMQNVDFLRTLSSKFPDIIEFMQEFSLMTDTADEETGVRIGSIHSSKGLEYDHVFLPAWEQGVMPSQRALEEIPGDIDDPWTGPPIGGVEEERRIAHVALTRARKSVMVTGAKARNKQKTRPSAFLQTGGIGRPARGPEIEEMDDAQASGGPECSGITFPNAKAPRRRHRPNVRFRKRESRPRPELQ
ncbi:ATP-dependent helicase [Salipiger mucosus]|uniref:DNA 3'-5' helicase n=1 Tax=Salipiger mucosus DSM 16094 TaxID=1123237 RepID=S9RZS2_9RHOB|nr:ATP-dependent helicase [Salipiger mucosus]EPX83485.1 ATP-dependent DNA helicase UvrD/PcrA [Salipiger mucosus DSM 16094]